VRGDPDGHDESYAYQQDHPDRHKRAPGALMPPGGLVVHDGSGQIGIHMSTVFQVPSGFQVPTVIRMVVVMVVVATHHTAGQASRDSAVFCPVMHVQSPRCVERSQ
jgi:hypothetical protein